MTEFEADSMTAHLCACFPSYRPNETERRLWSSVFRSSPVDIALAAIEGYKCETDRGWPVIGEVRRKLFAMGESSASHADSTRESEKAREWAAHAASAEADDAMARAWVDDASDSEISALIPRLTGIVMLHQHGMIERADKGSGRWNALKEYVMPHALTPARIRANCYLRGIAFALAGMGADQ